LKTVSELFPATVYTLCFLTSSACALLLARSYIKSRARLLLWSSLCFVFLALNNLAVVVDLVVIREISFQLVRIVLSLTGVALLLFGLVWDAEDNA
jgi:hypothetical protein